MTEVFLCLALFSLCSSFRFEPFNQAGKGRGEGCVARLNCVSARTICDGQLVLVLITSLG